MTQGVADETETKKVSDEELGRLSRQWHDLFERVSKGSLPVEDVRKNLQAINEGRFSDVLVSDGARYRRHPNGGGLVAETAEVALTAYVGPFALVQGYAKVQGSARIEDHAVVKHNAIVKNNAQIFGDARVFGDDWVPIEFLL